MDTKTNELVLAALLKIKNDRYVKLPIPKIIELHPELTEEYVEASIQDLSDNKLVKYQTGDGTIYTLEVTRKGIGYFREKDELTEHEIKKKKADDREKMYFTLFGAAIGIVSSLIGRYIDTWVSWIWNLLLKYCN